MKIYRLRILSNCLKIQVYLIYDYLGNLKQVVKIFIDLMLQLQYAVGILKRY